MTHAVIEDFVPPHNIEAEMCALGAMLLSERASDEVAVMLEDRDFYRPAHQEIYRCIRQLAIERTAIDLVTLKSELIARNQLEAIGGVDYLVQIAESVPSAANATHYAQIVLDNSMMRRLSETGHQIVQLVRNPELDTDEKLDEAERLLFENGRNRLGKHFAPVRSLAKDFFADVENLVESGEPILGSPSKFYDLDRTTGGFYGGELTIVAARPSMGKTSLVLSFALNVANESKKNVAIFSIEMSGKQLVRRMISMLSGVSMSAMKRPNLSTDEFEKLADACERLYGLPIYVDDSSDISPLEMRGKCRRLAADGELGLVMVDYLQLMRGSKRTENRVQEIGEIARSLKSLARELDVPVIALSQLNRGVEARPDKRPMLSDIRESGSIEAEADLVMFIYREAYYKSREAGGEEQVFDPNATEEAEIIIAKHRNGPTKTITLGFQPNYARFVNLKY